MHCFGIALEEQHYGDAGDADRARGDSESPTRPTGGVFGIIFSILV